MAENVCLSPSKLKDLINAFARLKLTGPQTKSLMQRLGVDLNVLDDIDVSRRGSGADRKAHYTKAWLDIELSPTWGKIIAALQLQGLKAQAKNLAGMVGVDPKTVDIELPESPMTDPLGVISTIESALTSFDSNRVSQEETRALFRGLGVPDADLDDIDGEHVGDDRKSHYAQAWLNIESQPKMEDIISGLQLIGKVAKAGELEVKNSVGGGEKVAKETAEATRKTENN